MELDSLLAIFPLWKKVYINSFRRQMISVAISLAANKWHAIWSFFSSLLFFFLASSWPLTFFKREAGKESTKKDLIKMLHWIFNKFDNSTVWAYTGRNSKRVRLSDASHESPRQWKTVKTSQIWFCWKILRSNFRALQHLLEVLRWSLFI